MNAALESAAAWLLLCSIAPQRMGHEPPSGLGFTAVTPNLRFAEACWEETLPH
jgi:hypothetical protein